MQQGTKRKRAIDWCGWCVAIVLIGAVAAGLFPGYLGQFEKVRVLSMHAMLINVLVAQEQYHAAKGIYTDQWTELLPYVVQPDIMEVELENVGDDPHTYFFGFGKNAARKQRGYWVSLKIDADQKNGTITAKRTANWFYHYELTQPFPDGHVTCKGLKRSQRFCKHFLASVEELSLTNLIPAPSNKTDRSTRNQKIK